MYAWQCAMYTIPTADKRIKSRSIPEQGLFVVGDRKHAVEHTINSFAALEIQTRPMKIGAQIRIGMWDETSDCDRVYNTKFVAWDDVSGILARVVVCC